MSSCELHYGWVKVVSMVMMFMSLIMIIFILMYIMTIMMVMTSTSPSISMTVPNHHHHHHRQDHSGQYLYHDHDHDRWWYWQGHSILDHFQVRGVWIRSQVPQPTFYGKWVGVSIPQKVGNFSLRPSSTAIWQRSRLRGGLLSFYGRWLSLTPTLNFHISTSAV